MTPGERQVLAAVEQSIELVGAGEQAHHVLGVAVKPLRLTPSLRAAVCTSALCEAEAVISL
jgi:hypothetical protein